MQLYFNVIKNSRVIEQGDMEINTQLSEVPIAVTVGDQHNIQNANMESYEKIASNILENARNESEKITSKAFIDAAEAKTCAIKEGMEQGSKEGYENAYNDAISGAMDEAAKVKAKADSILIAAKSEYDEYFSRERKAHKRLNCKYS